MTDKEKIILSSVGGLVTLVLGYLIWRHEQTVQAAANAQNQAAQADIAAQQDAEIQQEIAAIPSGATLSDESSPSSGSTSTSTQLQTPASDDNLAAILEAFFGQQGNTTPSNPNTPTEPNTPDQPPSPGAVAIPFPGTPDQPPSPGAVTVPLPTSPSYPASPVTPYPTPKPVGPAPVRPPVAAPVSNASASSGVVARVQPNVHYVAGR